MDKVAIELNIEDAKLIKTWLNNTDYFDTKEIVDKFHLGINAIDTDNALYRLCKQLGERC